MSSHSHFLILPTLAVRCKGIESGDIGRKLIGRNYCSSAPSASLFVNLRLELHPGVVPETYFLVTTESEKSFLDNQIFMQKHFGSQ